MCCQAAIAERKALRDRKQPPTAAATPPKPQKRVTISSERPEELGPPREHASSVDAPPKGSSCANPFDESDDEDYFDVFDAAEASGSSAGNVDGHLFSSEEDETEEDAERMRQGSVVAPISADRLAPTLEPMEPRGRKGKNRDEDIPMLEAKIGRANAAKVVEYYVITT